MKVLFTEKQKFKQIWLWALITVIDILIFLAAYNRFFTEENPVSGKSDDAGLWIGIITMTLITLLFLLIKLATEIKEDGIYYQLFPFHLKPKKITPDQISKAFVRRYNPLSEYGGWGLRVGLADRGKAVNISGRMGLQIIFKNGKKLLIGTQKPEELEKAVRKVFDEQIIRNKE